MLLNVKGDGTECQILHQAPAADDSKCQTLMTSNIRSWRHRISTVDDIDSHIIMTQCIRSYWYRSSEV